MYGASGLRVEVSLRDFRFRPTTQNELKLVKLIILSIFLPVSKILIDAFFIWKCHHPTTANKLQYLVTYLNYLFNLVFSYGLLHNRVFYLRKTFKFLLSLFITNGSLNVIFISLLFEHGPNLNREPRERHLTTVLIGLIFFAPSLASSLPSFLTLSLNGFFLLLYLSLVLK